MFSTPEHLPISHSPPILSPLQHLPPNVERKWKLHLETAPNCPRCASSNTKFCYYNNYSLSQPRYFCKSCRRYWTKGGSLRNVPVGGGCRKTRRPKSSRPASHRTADPVHSASQTDSNDGSSSTGSDIDLAAVFARFLNSPSSEPPSETATGLTGSPDSVDPLDGLAVENSEFFDGLSDFLMNEETQEEKQVQGITEIENELWAEFQDFGCVCSNYNNANDQLSWVGDAYCQVGDNWSSMDVTPDFEVLSIP